jgi:hypothetical protein
MQGPKKTKRNYQNQGDFKREPTGRTGDLRQPSTETQSVWLNLDVQTISAQ